MANTTITTCEGTFTDSGGGSGGYSNNEDLSMTFCPDNPGMNIQLVFSGVNILQGDQMCFYDGIDNTANEITCYYEEFAGANAFIIQATAANTSGCLTIDFQSDGANQGAGWSAFINCITNCQNIFAVLDSIYPAPMPADTGWVDICPGDRVEFWGTGLYPQDGVVYNHSDLTSSFVWDFGDGTSAVGPNVTHVYEEPGGYTVQLTITDQNGCTNLNFLGQRIRVATYPEFTIGEDLEPICAGDTLNLQASVGTVNSSSIISANSTEGSFPSGGIISDSLALPDGVDVPYSTSIVFTEFSPGQVLTDINDLLGICVNIEHSWMHDLEISIECPNGTINMLQFQEQITNEVFLGIPNETDDFVDPAPPVPLPGTGAEYCWTPFSTNGTWTEYTAANDTGGFGPYSLPSGDYEPYESFNNLLGCPLNGEWTILVYDRWGSDNGWIFEWSIDFAEDLYPDLETFEPQIVDFHWEERPSIISYSNDSLDISAVPTFGGEALYTFTIEDEFGCVSDTFLTVDVLPFAHPDCYDCAESIAPLADTTICSGSNLLFNAASENPPGVVSGFETIPQQAFGASTNPPINPLYLPIDVSFINPGTLTDPATQIAAVCIEIYTDWNADLDISLQSPEGTIMPLSTGNGGASDHYIQTCFTPDATIPITSGIGPFTGTFIPEGDWSVFTGQAVNGEWNLVVSDAFGFNDLGEVFSWSITFNSVNEPSFVWSGANLSCTTCPDPIASPTTTETYIVTSMDSYGCSYSDSVTVNVADDIAAPIVDCISSDNSSILFNWMPVDNFTEYEYRVILNGTPGAWQGPVTDLTYTQNSLVFGDEVTLEVRVFLNGAPLNCGVLIGSSSCTYGNCSLIASLTATPEDASCYEATDGSASISAMNGITPYSYYLISNPAPQMDGNFTGLAAGNYQAVVEDNVGCQDTVSFTINQPDSIEVAIALDQPLDCYDGNNGILSASANGGDGNFSFEWNTTPPIMTSTASGLSANDYLVTVMDGEGCIGDASFTLTQPDSIDISFNVTPASCSGTADGAIQATASGGTPPLTLSWSNSQSGNDLSGLIPGTYCVTIEDANGCQKVSCVDVNTPVELVVDSVSTTSVLCNGGNTGSATIYISGGNGNYTYQWDDNLSQTGQTAIMLEIGSYNVVVTDENGCEITAIADVDEPEVLNIGFDVEDALCNGSDDGTATAQITGGVAPYNYMWEDGQVTQTATGLSAGNYDITITDDNDCVLTANTDVGEPAEAVALTFEQTQMGCAGEQQNEVLATASGGTGNNYSYEWSNGQTNALATDLDSLPYTLTVMDENGCIATASFTPIDLEAIDFLIIDTPPSCNGYQDGRLGINQVSGGGGADIDDYTINWSTGATGATAEGLEGGVTYSVTVTSPQGCEQVRTRTLQEPSPITFNIETADVLCFGENSGNAEVVNVSGEFAPFTYLWSDGQVQALASNLTAGDYGVTVSDNTGCFAILTTSITEPEALTIDFETEDTPCFGSQGGSVMAGVKGGVASYNYLWSNGSTQSGQSGLSAGIYELTVTDQNGCTETITANIEQPEPLTTSFELTDPSCFDFSDGSIIVDVGGGTIPYRYSLDGDFFSGSSSLIALEAGDYHVFVQDANGCITVENVSLNNPPEFSVDAGLASYTIVLGDSIRLYGEAENAVGLVDFVWEAPYEGTLSCVNCDNTTSTPQVSILYQLYGIDENGCEDTDKVHVYVDKPRVVAVPTGFTPNGDNMNDVLMVHGRQGTVVQYFQVFDRWGELLYEARDFNVNDSSVGWDGTYRGEAISGGTYIWQLLVTYEDGMEELYFGESTLIR
ncbi:MAG: PKD domain-containing protein [Chitinophagales bacterium]|nr:PKD domain-containing protein [Chitinophagales bacterium]